VDHLGREHRQPPLVLVSDNADALSGPLVSGSSVSSSSTGRATVDAHRRERGPGASWSSMPASAVESRIDGETVELAPSLEFVVRLPGPKTLAFASQIE
jgi:hypothetical protein